MSFCLLSISCDMICSLSGRSGRGPRARQRLGAWAQYSFFTRTRPLRWRVFPREGGDPDLPAPGTSRAEPDAPAVTRGHAGRAPSGPACAAQHGLQPRPASCQAALSLSLSLSLCLPISLSPLSLSDPSLSLCVSLA